MTTLYDITKYAKDRGLVGEEKGFLVCTSALVARKPIGVLIVSAAGSGKTVIMDKLVGDEGLNEDALIDSRFLYFKDMASSTADFYDQKINNAPIMVMKELQKDKSHNAIEMMKSLTEGKSARRKVTDVTIGDVREQVIEAKCVFGSLAIENEHKPDAELQRRCITVTTDVSKEQTTKVLELKASLKYNPQSLRVISDDEVNEIRASINALMQMKIKVVNPYAVEFAKLVAKIAPDQKARSMMEHFWDVMEGVVKINSLAGPIFVNGDCILANIQDLLMTMDIYMDSFINDLHGIPPMGAIVLQGFKDAEVMIKEDTGKSMSSDLSKFSLDGSFKAKAWLTINQIREAIRKRQNVNLKTKAVTDIVKQLIDAGYVEDNRDNKTITYQMVEDFASTINIDNQAFIEAASALIKRDFPETFEEWSQKQYSAYKHPITGEAVEIWTSSK